MKKGFTLIELIIVIALISILGFLSTGFYSRFYNQNAVSTITDELTQEFRKAQIYAMMGKQNGNWGVHNNTTSIILFQGSTFVGRNTAFDETFTVNSNITITGLTDLIFFRMTGTPSATPTIIISNANNTRTITVNSQGVVNR
jgi:prepilin-type N-terminal cleavage/methylation domain-containing protein